MPKSIFVVVGHTPNGIAPLVAALTRKNVQKALDQAAKRLGGQLLPGFQVYEGEVRKGELTVDDIPLVEEER